MNNLTFARRTGKVVLDAETYLKEGLGVTSDILEEPYKSGFQMGDSMVVARYLEVELKRWENEKEAYLGSDAEPNEEWLGVINSVIRFLESALHISLTKP